MRGLHPRRRGVNIAGVEILTHALLSLVSLAAGVLVALWFSRLRASRTRDRTRVDPGGLAGVQARLVALEELQLQRDLAWHETKDQVSRHLKRIQAIEARRRSAPELALEPPADDDDQDQVTEAEIDRAILRAKFR
jgi:hypothetical protein